MVIYGVDITGSLFVSGSSNFKGDINVSGSQIVSGSLNVLNSLLLNGQPFVGTQGSQGIQGSIGVQGTNGSNGAQGNQGPTGIQGTNGTVGTQGNQGPTGLQGSTGLQGNQGPTGLQGTNGTVGTQGNQGPTGLQGTVGTQGATGVSAGITSYTNPADNRVLTSVNSTTINAESNLIFDGTNLGIGTTTPSSKLHVVGTSKLKGEVLADNLGYNSIVPIFGQPRIELVELCDVLWQADKRFTLTGFPSNPEQLFSGQFGGGYALPTHTIIVMNINVAGQSGAVPIYGYTYPEGKIYISFYSSSNNYNSISLRTKKNGVWITSSAPTDVSTSGTFKVLKFIIGSQNYLTDIELTIDVGSTSVLLSSINYIPDRFTNEMELPFLTKYSSGNQTIFSKLGIGTTSPTSNLSFDGSASKTVGMERVTTSDTAGNSLTISASSATVGATDKNGGDVIISGGVATGTGSSRVVFRTATANFSTGTGDRTPSDKVIITGSGTIIQNGVASTFITGTCLANQTVSLGYTTVSGGRLRVHAIITPTDGTSIGAQKMSVIGNSTGGISEVVISNTTTATIGSWTFSGNGTFFGITKNAGSASTACTYLIEIIGNLA